MEDILQVPIVLVRVSCLPKGELCVGCVKVTEASNVIYEGDRGISCGLCEGCRGQERPIPRISRYDQQPRHIMGRGNLLCGRHKQTAIGCRVAAFHTPSTREQSWVGCRQVNDTYNYLGWAAGRSTTPINVGGLFVVSRYT